MYTVRYIYKKVYKNYQGRVHFALLNIEFSSNKSFDNLSFMSANLVLVNCLLYTDFLFVV